MTGESPLSIMQGDGERMGRRGRRAPVAPPRRTIWRFIVPVVVLVGLAAVWCGLWYYAAGVANRTLAGWIASEAAAGRDYTCGSEGVGGFPFSIQVRCSQAAATFKSAQPQLDVAANDITFTAQVWRPTVLIGDVVGPVTVAAPGQAPTLVANWSSARMRVEGVPPNPEAISIDVERPHLDRGGGGAGASALFVADSAQLAARIVSGSIQNHPVIDIALHFVSAAAPTLNPALAQPVRGDIDVVLRGFKDLEQKPLAQRFRELQAAGGQVEIEQSRIQQGDLVAVASGTLGLTDKGNLNGELQMIVAGIEKVIPALGLEKMLEDGVPQGTLDKIVPGVKTQDVNNLFGALDRAIPGLGKIVKQNVNVGVAAGINALGKEAELEGKKARAFPLRFVDGAVLLGPIKVAQIPPLF